MRLMHIGSVCGAAIQRKTFSHVNKSTIATSQEVATALQFCYGCSLLELMTAANQIGLLE